MEHALVLAGAGTGRRWYWQALVLAGAGTSRRSYWQALVLGFFRGSKPWHQIVYHGCIVAFTEKRWPTKKMSLLSNATVQECLKLLNFIKSLPLPPNSRIFSTSMKVH